MSVHQLSDGRWFCQWPDKTKKSGYARKYFGRGVEAEKEARSHNEGLGLAPRRAAREKPWAPPFDDLATAYLEAKAATVSETTLKASYYKLKSIISPIIGHLNIHQFSMATMDRYVARRRSQCRKVHIGKGKMKKTDTPIKMVTVHTEITLIQSVLNWSRKTGLISRNPVAGYEKPQRDDAAIRPPSSGEIDRIIAAASPHLVRAIVLSYYLGCRPGAVELLRMRWDENVDFEAGRIHVISARKGGLNRRSVPVHSDLLPLLASWKKKDQADSIPWIIHWRGNPVARIKGAWNSAKRRAGITRRLRPYDLRHAFASALLSQSSDLKTVSELIGHTRTETTTRIYQHIPDGHDAKVINLLPRLNVPKSALGKGSYLPTITDKK